MKKYENVAFLTSLFVIKIPDINAHTLIGNKRKLSYCYNIHWRVFCKINSQ